MFQELCLLVVELLLIDAILLEPEEGLFVHRQQPLDVQHQDHTRLVGGPLLHEYLPQLATTELPLQHLRLRINRCSRALTRIHEFRQPRLH
jgi:hypothetical protein